MMKTLQLGILGLAVAAGGGAYFVGNNLMNRPPEVVEVQSDGPRVELEEVLVASQDISLGTNIQGGMVEWRSWPQEGLAEGFITRSGNPGGLGLEETPAIARSAFFVGEPIRESKLVRSGKGYMSAILPAGQRAIATSISTATSAGGFVLPNDRVDVLMTRRVGDGDETNFITDTILENVRVLAIDQTIEDEEGQPVVVGETATLQLTPEQTRILTTAQQFATRLSLTLRSLEDSGDQITKSSDSFLQAGESGRVSVVRYGNRREVITKPSSQAQSQ